MQRNGKKILPEDIPDMIKSLEAYSLNETSEFIEPWANSWGVSHKDFLDICDKNYDLKKTYEIAKDRLGVRMAQKGLEGKYVPSIANRFISLNLRVLKEQEIEDKKEEKKIDVQNSDNFFKAFTDALVNQQSKVTEINEIAAINDEIWDEWDVEEDRVT